MGNTLPFFMPYHFKALITRNTRQAGPQKVSHNRGIHDMKLGASPQLECWNFGTLEKWVYGESEACLDGK